MAQKEHCGLLIHQIHNVLEKRGNQQLKDKGLTFSQINLLLQLIDTSEKKLSFKEMEKKLVLAQSTTVGLISRLEQKGMVHVSEDKDDKRIKFVEITPLGTTYCNDAKEEMQQTENKLLSSLSENERNTFRYLLKKIEASLQKN